MRTPDLVSVRMNRIHSFVKSHAFLAELKAHHSTDILTKQQQRRAREITATQLVLHSAEIDYIYPKVEERIRRDKERVRYGFQALRTSGQHGR